MVVTVMPSHVSMLIAVCLLFAATPRAATARAPTKKACNVRVVTIPPRPGVKPNWLSPDELCVRPEVLRLVSSATGTSLPGDDCGIAGGGTWGQPLLFKKLKPVVAPSEAMQLAVYENPVVRRVFAYRAATGRPKEVSKLYPLLADEVEVTWCLGCEGGGYVGWETGLGAIKAGDERKALRLLRRASRDGRLLPVVREGAREAIRSILKLRRKRAQARRARRRRR